MASALRFVSPIPRENARFRGFNSSDCMECRLVKFPNESYEDLRPEQTRKDSTVLQCQQSTEEARLVCSS